MRLQYRMWLAAAVLLLIGAHILRADEFRGLYVDAFHPGFKSRAEVTQMVTAATAANVNALIVQVRKRGDAYYKSAIVPRAADIAADYDPLADIITQAHSQGIEVHAWLSVYEVALDCKWYAPAADSIHLTRPEWLMSDQAGRTALDHGKIYLDPGLPAVQEHVLSVVCEVVSNYAVDGVHLDNIRYPSVGAGYNAQSVARFNAETGKSGTPNPNDPDWRKWRTEQVNSLVAGIRKVLSESKTSVKLSASVMCSDPRLAAMQFLQEWDAWTRDGLVDFVVPMVYLTGDSMGVESAKSLAASHDRHVYIGVGAWRIPGALAAKHITDAKAAGAPGVVLYSYHYLGPNSPKAEVSKLSDLKASVFTERTPTAPMAWLEEGGVR